MDRRRFLQLVGAAGALVLSASSSRVFAQQPVHESAPPSTLTLAALSAAYRQAQREGKPLLVLVVPDTTGVEHPHPTAGAAEPLRPAGEAMVEAIAHGMVPQGAQDLVLVETDSVPARTTAVTPRFPPPANDVVVEWTRERVSARRAAVTAALHAAVAPDHATLVRRAGQVRASLDARTLERVDRIAEHPTAPDASVVDRGAAVLALVAESAPPRRRTALREALWRDAISRLREHDIPGSVWGLDVSSECNYCPGAHEPWPNARFLHFFAEPGYTRGGYHFPLPNDLPISAH